MTTRACDRSWEVEAARDGRLSGEAAFRLERHTRRCGVCAEHARYVADLAARLAALPVPALSDVALRRLRGTVLEQADAELAGRTRADTRRRWRRLALAGSLAVAFGAFAGWRGLRSPSVATTRPSLTVVRTTDEGGARWAKQSENDVERIDLLEGTLRLSVRRPSGGKRVVVRVPDGEIEDVGTTFHVVVREGHTQRVAVDEGRVTVRLASIRPFTLSSGERWERPPPPANVEPRSAGPEPVPVKSGSAPRAVPKAPPARSATRAVTAPAPATSDEDEDAAYIEAIRLAREGRTEEARAAAHAYLRRFPNGFRREEAGQLAK